MSLERGEGGGSYSSFKNRAEQRLLDLLQPDLNLTENGPFPKKKKKSLKKDSNVDADLAALLLGQKGVPARDNRKTKNAFDILFPGAGQEKTAQLDPRLQALLDERNRKKKHAKNYREAEKHYGGNAKLPKRRRGGGGGRRNESDDLTQYLEGYLAEKMATQGATFDYEKALRDSAKEIREAYRRDIKAIRSSNKAARRDTAANRKDVEALYNSLAASYAQSADEAIASGQELANMMQEVTQGTQANLAELSSGIANEQSELLKGLGVEEAAEAFMPEQAENTQSQLSKLAAMGAEDANRQLGYAGNQQRWLDRGAQNAKLEGANQSAILLRDLQDYIQGNRDEISDLKSMRGREIASTKDDIIASIAEQQAAQDEALWNQLMQFSNLKLDIEDTQADNDLARRKHRLNIREGNREARQWAAEMGLDLDRFEWDKKMDARELALALEKARTSASGGGPNSPLPNYLQDFNSYLGQLPPRLRNISSEVVKTRPFQTGIYNDKTSKRELNMNPSLAAEVAKKYAQQRGINDPQKLNMIAIAAMIYAEGGF